MRRRILARLAALLAVVLLFTGCWDQNMINRIIVVSGMGIDWLDDEKCFLVTVEVIKLSAGKDDEMSSLILEGKSNTILEALSNAAGKSSGWFYTNHCKILLVGEGLAQKGIRPVIDLLLRTTQFQPSMSIVVAKGAAAGELLHQPSRNNPMISIEIGDIIDVETKRTSQAVATSGIEFNNILAQKNGSALVPALELDGEGDEKSIQSAGTAVFRDDKVAGYLSPDDTKYLLLARGDAKSGLLQSNTSPTAERCVLSYLLHADAKTEPFIAPDRLGVLIRVAVSLQMEEMLGAGYSVEDIGGINQIERDYEESLKSNILRVVEKSQRELGCDLLGFGTAFEAKYRNEWNEYIERNWDERFRALDVTVDVQAVLKNSGSIANDRTAVEVKK